MFFQKFPFSVWHILFGGEGGKAQHLKKIYWHCAIFNIPGPPWVPHIEVWFSVKTGNMFVCLRQPKMTYLIWLKKCEKITYVYVGWHQIKVCGKFEGFKCNCYCAINSQRSYQFLSVWNKPLLWRCCRVWNVHHKRFYLQNKAMQTNTSRRTAAWNEPIWQVVRILPSHFLVMFYPYKEVHMTTKCNGKILTMCYPFWITKSTHSLHKLSHMTKPSLLSFCVTRCWDCPTPSLWHPSSSQSVVALITLARSS